MFGRGVLLGFKVLLSINVLRVSTDNCGFGGEPGLCNGGNTCPPNWAPGKFPPGGSLCIGSQKRCCFPADKAACMNLGGLCVDVINDIPCVGLYKRLHGAPLDICPKDHYCCVRADEDKCIQAGGTCHDELAGCPTKFQPVTFPLTDLCPIGKVCCVHQNVEPCESKDICPGRCRGENDCKSNEVTGKFPRGGDLCGGKDCKCCVDEGKADCVNKGGMCIPAACSYAPDHMDLAGSCTQGYSCCVHVDDEPCIDAGGACLDISKFKSGTCPVDFFDAGLPCRAGYTCCLHDGIEPCKSRLCPGKCRGDNDCKSNEVSGTFPKDDGLCGGEDCKCCVDEEKAGCINKGGECFTQTCDIVVPPGGAAGDYQNLDGSCPGGQHCCELKADEECHEINGKCLNKGCPYPFITIVGSGIYCRAGYYCCVHKDDVDCALKAKGKCIKTDKCPAPYVSAKGVGTCRGKKMKCCKMPFF